MKLLITFFGNIMKYISILLMLFFLAEATSATARETDENLPRFERVGGTYLVTTIQKLEDESFLIEFKSTTPSGKFDILKLSSDHVHVAVKVGQKIRLSAEILSVTGNVAEVSQVLLFLNTGRGKVPVWMLSNRERPSELRGARYLEMHVPMTDYIIL